MSKKEEEELRALVIQDRNIIRVLQRSIESLTNQMKEITQVTFERDIYKGNLERQMDISNYLRNKRDELIEYNDRLNDIIGNMRLEIDTLKERLAQYE